MVEDDPDDQEEEVIRFAKEHQRFQVFLDVLQGQNAYLTQQVKCEHEKLSKLCELMKTVTLAYSAQNAANGKCCKRRGEELFRSMSDESSESTDEFDVEDGMSEVNGVVYRGLGDDHDDEALFGPGGPDGNALDMNDSTSASSVHEGALPRSARVAAVMDELENSVGGTADEVALAMQAATTQLEELLRGVTL